MGSLNFTATQISVAPATVGLPYLIIGVLGGGGFLGLLVMVAMVPVVCCVVVANRKKKARLNNLMMEMGRMEAGMASECRAGNGGCALYRV